MMFTANPGVINYVNTGGGANFGGDATFPGFTSHLNLLQSGSNVLALHGLNFSASDSDFVIHAELMENKILGLTNQPLLRDANARHVQQRGLLRLRRKPQVHSGSRLVRHDELQRHDHQRHAGGQFMRVDHPLPGGVVGWPFSQIGVKDVP